MDVHALRTQCRTVTIRLLAPPASKRNLVLNQSRSHLHPRWKFPACQFNLWSFDALATPPVSLPHPRFQYYWKRHDCFQAPHSLCLAIDKLVQRSTEAHEKPFLCVWQCVWCISWLAWQSTYTWFIFILSHYSSGIPITCRNSRQVWLSLYLRNISN